MTALRLYNSLSRNLDPIVPGKDGRFGIYCCGPTTYDVPHAGHGRAALAPDTLVRFLRAEGESVDYVRNVTDVDDKILERSRKNGESPLELSARMAAVYCEQMAALGCLAPDHEPRVSAHIPQVITLIEELISTGAAYAVDMPSGTRDVYFSVRSFPDYGKLSRRKIDELQVGARIEKGETKRDPLDFALWKGAPREEWGWESPWGWGRPGWHIECSAMSRHYLGFGFSVHAGGMDLIFPHHENEIAQSEAACPGCGDFATTWIHNGFVNVDKEKMSKSLGNFVTVSDVFARNDPEAFRWFLLDVHYRGPIQFDTEKLEDGRVVFPGVDEAERRVDYLYATVERLEALSALAGATPVAKARPELAALKGIPNGVRKQAHQAMLEDLDTHQALTALCELLKGANELSDLALKRRKDEALIWAAAEVADEYLRVLGVLSEWLGLRQTSPALYTERTSERRLRCRGLSRDAVQKLVDDRDAARRSKDFPLSDKLRDELVSLGVVVKDTPTGAAWTVMV